MATYIAPISTGLGDLVVSLPAIQYLIARGELTILVQRSPRQDGLPELIPGLAGCIREVDFDVTAIGADDRFINLRDHPIQTEHLWGSAEFEAKFPGYKIMDIMRDICHDFGIMADFDNLEPLPFRRREEVRDAIVFVPGTGAIFKCWHKQRWLELKQKLEAAGERVIVVGQPDSSGAVKELVEAGITWVETASVRDALDVISSAKMVVSVDTGLMHLALNQQVPVVAIWVDQPGSFHFMRKDPHCFSLLSARCRPECVRGAFDMKLNEIVDFKEWEQMFVWDCPVPEAERCMSSITVDTVWQQTRQALQLSARRADRAPATSIGGYDH